MDKHVILFWTARIGGVAWLLLISFYLLQVPSTPPAEALANTPSQTPLLVFAGLGLAGYLLALRRPTQGGRLLMASAILLAAFFIYHGAIAQAFTWGLPPLLVGLCYMAADNKWLV